MTHSSTSFAQGLDVRVYGVRVGRLARDPHGEIRFTPDRQWLDDNQRPPLGLAFLCCLTLKLQPWHGLQQLA